MVPLLLVLIIACIGLLVMEVTKKPVVAERLALGIFVLVSLTVILLTS